MADTKVSVVLPTFNECENIVPLIQGLHQEIDHPLEIIVVDDNSSDGTADAVEALGDPNVVLIRRKVRGLAAAFHRGVLESTGQIVCWMDADMCMPPHVLAQMIGELDHHDIVVGSRYAEGGRDTRSPIRVFASRAINGFANMVLGGNIKDYDSGFVALRRDVFNTVSLIPFGYGEYFIELLYDAHRAGLRIKEVGFSFSDRVEGVSKTVQSLWQFVRLGMHYVFRIVSLRFRFLRGGH